MTSGHSTSGIGSDFPFEPREPCPDFCGGGWSLRTAIGREHLAASLKILVEENPIEELPEDDIRALSGTIERWIRPEYGFSGPGNE